MKYCIRWSTDEFKKLEDLMKLKYNTSEIAKILGRTESSVRNHIRRIRTTTKTYGNMKGRTYKRELDVEFVNLIKPKHILDVYTGPQTHYPEDITTTNDIDKCFKADWHLPSYQLLAQFLATGCKYDLIDLDPWGSAYECLPMAIQLVKKGLVVSYGELYMKIFKRNDFAQSRYGLYYDKYGFTLDMLIEFTKHLGLYYKKELVVWNKYDFNHFGRVYYIVKPFIQKQNKAWNTIQKMKEKLNGKA